MPAIRVEEEEAWPPAPAPTGGGDGSDAHAEGTGTNDVGFGVAVACTGQCCHKVVRDGSGVTMCFYLTFFMVLTLAHVHPIENVWHICGDVGVIHMHVA